MHATEHIFADTTLWQQGATNIIADALRHAINLRGSCTLGLSGGSTPAPVYEALAREAIDWSAVTIFLADERCVSSTDPRSNRHLVLTHLLDSLQMQPSTLFPDTALPPDACADAYDMQLRAMLKEQSADVLILGLGPDGHTASLFPPVLDINPDCFAIPTQTDSFDVRDRISITPLVLRKTKVPIVLLQGEEKLNVWRTMMSASYDPVRWPLHDALITENALLLGCR